MLLAVCAHPAATYSDARLLLPANDDELNAFDKVVQQRFHDVIGFEPVTMTGHQAAG